MDTIDPTLVKVKSPRGLIMGSFVGDNSFEKAQELAEELATTNGRFYWIVPSTGSKVKVEPKED